jgi:hypothetical protein
VLCRAERLRLSGSSGLCWGEERRTRARVIDWRHYPGPPMRSAWERQCAGPLCLPARALSSASGGSRWGRCGSRRTGSTTVSVVRCRCGFVSAAITATCIALGECGRIRRRESLKRAQTRYQRSRRGARRHAARQRRWRERQRQKLKIVTHHGSPITVTQCIVAVSPVMQSQPIDASPDEPEQLPQVRPPLERCAFCGATLPDWTRQRPWRWSG